MVTNRLADIFSLMEHYGRDDSPGLSLCRAAAEIMELDGASISLTSSDVEMTSLCAGESVAQSLCDLEITVNEGPAMDTIRMGVSVVEADLDSLRHRWPLYTPEALQLGARAVFSFPVRLGAIRFGALSLFRLSSGPLRANQASDGFLMASVVARSVLSMQAGASSDELLAEFHHGAQLDFRVHEAAGMLAVQGSMPVKDALVALRVHAFSTDTELSILAEHVVTRRIRLDPRGMEWVENPDGVA
ncbi:MAG: hypothetical protein JWM55_1445 [Acidimicrobiaceae bacterium]|nr:hypothetical protein [Acidimicrobiaceae bacterium]